MSRTDWEALETPGLVVDVGRLERNIAAVAERTAAAGITLRPHVKTTKCLEVARRQLAAGAIGFTCSTPAEVRWLSEAGIRGLLYAHQPVGAAKVRFAVEAASRWGVTLMADSLAVATPLSEEAVRQGVVADLLIEVDAGHGRTGVLPADAPAFVAAVGGLPGLRVRGIVCHEGNVAGRVGREARAELGGEVGALMAQLAAELREAGHAIDVVSVGSTPSLDSSPFVNGITEARPGTYVYFDGNQYRGGSCTPDQWAQTVITRVVSVAPGRAIIDAGLKAMSADAFTPEIGGGIVCSLDLEPLEGVEFRVANEEHGFLTGDIEHLRVGDLLRIVPNHACGTTNMWSKLTAVHPDGRTETWAIEARH